MESRGTLFLALAIVSAFLLIPSTRGATIAGTDADDSWDLIVARGNTIHFLKDDTEIRHSTVANVTAITALAYDSANRTLYMADYSEVNSGLLYRTDLVGENLNPQLFLDRDYHFRSTKVTSMVFDPLTQNLFWIDSANDRLMKMKVLSNGSHPEPEMLHDYHSNVAQSIALDACNRFIYWVTLRFIERSRLDGSGRETVMDGLSSSRSLWMAVDCCGGKLYFANKDRNSHSSIIEESNLDGTNRRFFVNATHQAPVSLSVDGTGVYWIDRTGSLSKVVRDGTAKRQIKLDGIVHPSQYPMRIMTRYSAGDGNCKTLKEKEKLSALEPLLS